MPFQHDDLSFTAANKLSASFRPIPTPRIPSLLPNSLVDEADSPVAPTQRRHDPFFSDSMLTTANNHPPNSYHEPLEKPEYQQRAFPAPGFPFISNGDDRPLHSLSPFRRHLKTISDRIPGLNFDYEFRLPNHTSSSTTYPSLQCEGSDDVFAPIQPQRTMHHRTSTAQTSLSPPPPKPRSHPTASFDHRDAAASRRSRRQATSSKAIDSPLPSHTSRQLRAQLFRNHLDQQTAKDMPSSSHSQRPLTSIFTSPQQPPFAPRQSSFSTAPFHNPHPDHSQLSTSNSHPLPRAYHPKPKYQPPTGEGMRSRYGAGDRDVRAPPGLPWLSPAERMMVRRRWESFLVFF